MSTITTNPVIATAEDRTRGAKSLMEMYAKATEKRIAVNEELHSIIEMLKQFSPQLVEGYYNDESSIDLSFKIDRNNFYENTYETLHDVISGAVTVVNDGNGEPSVHVDFERKLGLAAGAKLVYINDVYEVELFDEGSRVSFLTEEKLDLSSALEMILEHM